MKASIIVRTYNEALHLPALLDGIRRQQAPGLTWEVIVVDSGSTDDTIRIATEFGCRVEHIKKEEFSFGRSLNVGCAAATGEVLVIVSGHCYPVDDAWLANLTAPITAGTVVWTYGRQIGAASSFFSECQIFGKYYPMVSQIPQAGFFCNNANGALLKRVWERYRFDEEVTGLEDMHLAKRVVSDGRALGYVAEAPVVHVHTENWSKIKNRFEREAIALQRIMPEVHVNLADLVRYFVSGVAFDARAAVRERALFAKFASILMYRSAQYWGSYRGNHTHRRLSRDTKERYFYPR